MTLKRGNLFVISAPSGSGKTTLVKRLLENLDSVRFSVSFTTRGRRDAEVGGKDYHFISEESFREKISNNEFLEWAEVHGNLYGTSQVDTEDILNNGNDLLMDVDVQGAVQVRKVQPHAVSIFLMPPSFSVLGERLRGRQQDTKHTIDNRLDAARQEIQRYKDYDYVLVNDNVEQKTEWLKAIVIAERMRPFHAQSEIDQILDSFQQ